MTKEEIEERIKVVHEDMRHALFPSEHISHALELARLNRLLDDTPTGETVDSVPDLMVRMRGE